MQAKAILNSHLSKSLEIGTRKRTLNEQVESKTIFFVFYFLRGEAGNIGKSMGFHLPLFQGRSNRTRGSEEPFQTFQRCADREREREPQFVRPVLREDSISSRSLRSSGSCSRGNKAIKMLLVSRTKVVKIDRYHVSLLGGGPFRAFGAARERKHFLGIV